jgi:hypothetical protein
MPHTIQTVKVYTMSRFLLNCTHAYPHSTDAIHAKTNYSPTSVTFNKTFEFLVVYCHHIFQPLQQFQYILRQEGGLGNTQRQARGLISGPCLGAKARFLSFNRTQSRAVTGLLTGHNTLKRHLYLMGLSDSLLYRRCGAEDRTSAHTVCEREALASFRHVSGLPFLEPEDIKSIRLGAIWNLCKVKGLP